MLGKIKSIIGMLEDEKNRRLFRLFTILGIIILFIVSLSTDVNVREDKTYSDWDHVALYILKFDDLPDNYVPKSQGVSFDEFEVTVYAVYDNTREPVKLPEGFEYTEAYINATKEDIGQERFVFSDIQLFYTDDHYTTFEEISRSDILGVHYTFSLLFWLSFVGSSLIVIVSFKWGIMSIDIVREDLKSDWTLIKKYSKDKFDTLREKIES